MADKQAFFALAKDVATQHGIDYPDYKLEPINQGVGTKEREGESERARVCVVRSHVLCGIQVRVTRWGGGGQVSRCVCLCVCVCVCVVRAHGDEPQTRPLPMEHEAFN